jgi:hypothetical protein
MRVLLIFALLASVQVSSNAMAQAYSFTTNSTEFREIPSSAIEFHGLTAYVFQTYQNPLRYARVTQADKIQPLTDLINSMGCNPRGALLTELGPVGLSMSQSIRHYGILRKGQNITIELKLCADAADRDLPIFVPDITTSALKGGISKSSDVKVSLVSPNGSVIALDAIYYSKAKVARRAVVLRAIQSGGYKLVITGGTTDVTVDVTFELRSSGTEDVDTHLFAPQSF